MMDTEDKNISRFIKSHKTEINDNGFSRRVIRHLPGKAQRLSKAWTIFCITAAAILFVVLNGFQFIPEIGKDISNIIQHSSLAQMDPLRLTFVVFILMVIGINRLCSFK